jgi:sialate O-acetylesterase
MKKFLPFLLVILCGAPMLHADVTMPAIFGDHMMLQQGMKIPVWGWADPGEKIQVSLGKEQLRTVTDAQGNWRVEFPARINTANPTTLAVAGKTTLSFQDVIVGEIWMAAGQSNMAFPLGWLGGVPDWLKQRGEGNVLTSSNPQIRIFFVDGRASVRPDMKGGGHWMLFSPDAARDFSAVAYFFSEALQKNLGRPIGIISTPMGGTPIETWSSKEILATLPDKKPGLDLVAAEEAAYPTDPKQQQAVMDDFHKRDSDWVQTVEAPFHVAHDQWQKDSDAAKAANKPIPPEPPYPQTRPKNPDGEGGQYSTLFNGMICPEIGYPMRGVIWYQGEANGPPEYDTMLKNMVSDWRTRWHSEFTFLPVMLANIGPRFPTPSDNGWSGVRDAQERVSLELPKMGTAEAIDVGTDNNIHPYDKIDVGRRLAAQALRIAYGEKIISTGPRFGSMTVEGNKIRVKYKDIGSGLMLAVSPFVSNDPVNGNPALPTDKPLSFDIAGVDKKWYTAQAQIDGNDVLVWCDQVAAPVAVRYGWAQNPQINLYNNEGFPAVPFRTQDWPAESK